MSTVASSILDTLYGWGARYVMLVPGAHIDGFVKHLSQQSQLTPILANHELAAGYMADGYHRASGRIGVAMAIGGPGAANLLGASVTAKADASSVLFITGNMSATYLSRDTFQNAWPCGSNDSGVYTALLGHSGLVTKPADLEKNLMDARAALVRGYPAHIVVPVDVQYVEASHALAVPLDIPELTAAAPNLLIPRGRVLLVLGAGALDVIDRGRMCNVAEAWSLPIVTDMTARGIIPEDRPIALGHLGFMPHPRALAVLSLDPALSADTVLAVGVSSKLEKQFGEAKPWQQIEPAHFQAWLATCPPPDEATFMRAEWLKHLSSIRRPSQPKQSGSGFSLTALVDSLAENLAEDAIYCIDSGQIRRLAVKLLCARSPRTILSAEGTAPMGWAICAAIGAQLAQPNRSVVALTGDGSMRMHGIELATAARYHLPILFVICDNGGYGSIAARNQSFTDLASLPELDWVAFAQALGVPARRIADLTELVASVDAFSHSDSPLALVVEVPWIDPGAYNEPDGIDWLRGLAA